MRSIIFLTLLFMMVNNTNSQEPKVVKNVDLKRYSGTWYEIARFDHRFERGLVGVTATYTPNPDGTFTVINAGYKNSLDGKHSVAKGLAKVPNPEETGKLKVSFFWIFYAPYYILELDQKDYQYALVGSNSKDYLWILSRTPHMSVNVYNMLLDKAKARGYDIQKLIRVPQK